MWQCGNSVAVTVYRSAQYNELITSMQNFEESHFGTVFALGVEMMLTGVCQFVVSDNDAYC